MRAQSITFALPIVLAMAVPHLTLAQNGQCECNKNQRAIAFAIGSCSKTDLPNQCTIVFGHNQGNGEVSRFLQSNGIDAVPLQPEGTDTSPTSTNPVDQALDTLSRPPQLFRERAQKDPVRFTSTLYLALTASLAAPQSGEIPHTIALGREPTSLLDFLQSLLSGMEENAKLITEGFFSGGAEGRAAGYKYVARLGCFEIGDDTWSASVRALGTPTPPGLSCRGGR